MDMAKDIAQKIPPDKNETIDLLELAVIFFAEWRVGAVSVLIIFLIGTLITFSIQPLFEATATLLPKQTKEESGSLASIFAAKGPGEVYLGLLASRTIADQVIDNANLMLAYKVKSRQTARAILAANSKFTSGSDTLIKIRVKNPDAQRAAIIANAYLDALQNIQESMALFQSKLSRDFFEKQLDDEREQLTAAEQKLEKVQESSGLVQMDAQTQLGLTAIANARAEITSLRVQLAALLQSSTEQNPQVARLRSQISQMEAQSHKLESGSSHGNFGAALPAQKMPEANLEYLRSLRDVRYHETLLSSLSSQYENARLSEAYSANEFQIVDRAIVPEGRAWPPRILFLILSLLAGLIIGSIVMVLAILIRRVLSDQVQRQRLHLILNNFRSLR